MIDFALRLHRELPGVVCWSPYSVAAALHITLRLASGETRAQLLEVLGDKGLPSVHPPDFAVADRVWAREGMNLPDPVRWFDDVDTAVKLINADVEETTRGLIPSLLSSLHPATTAVLVNALYLKALWIEEFTDIGLEPFHTPDGTVEVPTMMIEERLRYASLHGWQVVAIPALDDVEAVVLMPKRSLDVTPDLLQTLLDAPQLREVRLTMPMLNLDYRAELREPLERLGAWGMFWSGEGFSDAGLIVDQVVHQTVLKVDESGIEGAAATAKILYMSFGDVMRDPVVFRVDKPFLFVVRHARTGAVYFMARVFHPASS